MEMNRSINLSPIALSIAMILFLGGVFLLHLWIADRPAIFKALYPIELRIAQFESGCDPAAEAWMKDLAGYINNHAGGLANQIAYVSSQGKLQHCELGWEGTFFRSSPVLSNTRFRYASTTKLITADAVVSLVRRGLLQFDTTLGQLFPELKPFEDPGVEGITIGMLLAHTGGFDRKKFADPMFELNVRPWCPSDVHKLAATKTHFSPGSRYAYSNLGYCILGMVVERVTGQSYREYVSQQYNLEQYNILFLEGPYLDDEVRYDFRYDEFYGEDYARFFDFYAISSSAGLSGSAKSLALLIKDLLQKEEPNLLSGVPLENCNLSLIKPCYAFSFFKYQHRESGRIFYVQEGYLPGSSSLVMVDDRGGILVVLSASALPGGQNEKEHIFGEIINYLLKAYST